MTQKNFSDMKDKMRQAGLFPVRVIIDEVKPDDDNAINFDGELDEYFEAVKALGKNVIFIGTREMEESDLTLCLSGDRVYDEDEGEFENEIEEYDLCAINPEFEKFKSKIGEIGMFKLFTSNTEDSLNYYPQEEWWTEYMVLAVETARKIKLNKKEVEKVQRQKEKEREKSLIKDVRALGKNSEFMSLKTQRAMAAYALENIEDLDELDPSVLKQEIQALHDKR